MSFMQILYIQSIGKINDYSENKGEFPCQTLMLRF